MSTIGDDRNGVYRGNAEMRVRLGGHVGVGYFRPLRARRRQGEGMKYAGQWLGPSHHITAARERMFFVCGLFTLCS
jgi:hypothetical protein